MSSPRYEDVTESLYGGNTLDLILFGYFTAFDVISHDALLNKLTFRYKRHHINTD